MFSSQSQIPKIDAPKDVVTVGQRLGHTSQYSGGVGTYISGHFVVASVVGEKTIVAPPKIDSKNTNEDKTLLPTIQVTSAKTAQTLPDLNSAVLGQILRISGRLANVAILAIDGRPAAEEFSGILRLQDIRKSETDKIEIFKCFRPGDIIKAKVISLGDSKSYFLSTAENELGVVFARGPAGEPMIPISWTEMQCPKTKIVELRKVAKPPSSDNVNQ